jgi:hypothetical protein
LGTASVFNVGVDGILVHILEIQQKVDMHRYWFELGGAINLVHNTGIFCITVEGFYLFHILLIFFMILSYLFYFEPLQGLALCIENVAP